MSQGILAMHHPLPNVVGQFGGSSQERGNGGDDVFIVRRVVSLVHAVIAVLLIIFGAVILVAFLPYNSHQCEPIHRSAVGVWCGTICLTTAVCGAIKTKNNVLNSLYLAFSMFTFVATAIGIVIVGIGIGICNNTRVYYIVILCLDALAMLLSIVGSSLTCSEWGCCARAPTVIYYNAGGTTPQEPVNPRVLHTYCPPSIVQQGPTQADPYYCEPNDPVAYQSSKPNQPHYYELTIHNEA